MSKEEINQKIGQLLATTELSAKQIIQQVLGKKSPVQAELQLVYGHPEWKARKERQTKKRLEELKPPTPPEEGKEPEIEVEKLPPTKPPVEKPEVKEEITEKIIAGKPLEKGMFTPLLNSGFEFICDARPHLKRPSPASIENLDDALVDFLNTQDIRLWIGQHWTKLNLIFASGVIAVPLIKQEYDHRREAKKPKKEEEKKPEAPPKEASVTVPTTPTAEGSVTLTATPPPPESEKPDWYYKLKGEQPPT